jgi:hypothetical protein
MDWLLILLAAALVAVASRAYFSVRKVRRDQLENWDAKVIERLRKQGSDPFKVYEVDFFFAAPDELAAAQIRRRLETDGFSVDTKHVESDPEYPFSVHAHKPMRLSAPDMSALSATFGAIAKENRSRYDGWTA